LFEDFQRIDKTIVMFDGFIDVPETSTMSSFQYITYLKVKSGYWQHEPHILHIKKLSIESLISLERKTFEGRVCDVCTLSNFLNGCLVYSLHPATASWLNKRYCRY